MPHWWFSAHNDLMPPVPPGSCPVGSSGGLCLPRPFHPASWIQLRKYGLSWDSPSTNLISSHSRVFWVHFWSAQATSKVAPTPGHGSGRIPVKQACELLESLITLKGIIPGTSLFLSSQGELKESGFWVSNSKCSVCHQSEQLLPFLTYLSHIRSVVGEIWVFSKAFLEVSCWTTPSCYERTEEQKTPPGTGNQTSDNKIKENIYLVFLIEKSLKPQPWKVSAKTCFLVKIHRVCKKGNKDGKLQGKRTACILRGEGVEINEEIRQPTRGKGLFHDQRQ